jgi:hypothetical protein
MQEAGRNILENASKEDFSNIRKFVVHGILSTDMTSHFEIMKKIEIQVKNACFAPDEGIPRH